MFEGSATPRVSLPGQVDSVCFPRVLRPTTSGQAMSPSLFFLPGVPLALLVPRPLAWQP